MNQNDNSPDFKKFLVQNLTRQIIGILVGFVYIIYNIIFYQYISNFSSILEIVQSILLILLIIFYIREMYISAKIYKKYFKLKWFCASLILSPILFVFSLTGFFFLAVTKNNIRTYGNSNIYSQEPILVFFLTIIYIFSFTNFFLVMFLNDIWEYYQSKK